ncbi:MAG: hypothetical protein AAF411_25005 [Myxococcota bacterium]
MKEVCFFATPEDIRPVLERFEAFEPIQYVEMQMRTDDLRAVYMSSEQLPDAGQANDRDANFCERYLICPRDAKVSVQTMKMKNGKTRRDVFAVDNPEGASLTTAGIWRHDILLPGRMTAMHRNASSDAIIKNFRSAIRKEKFKKVKAFWVGPAAMGWLRDGKRLPSGGDADDPTSLDLKATSETL